MDELFEKLKALIANLGIKTDTVYIKLRVNTLLDKVVNTDGMQYAPGVEVHGRTETQALNALRDWEKYEPNQYDIPNAIVTIRLRKVTVMAQRK